MSNGAIDGNSKSTMTAILNTDGRTIERVSANPSNGQLSTTFTTSGSVIPNEFSFTDENDRPTLFAVSEDDGITPIAVVCNASGAILIKSI